MTTSMACLAVYINDGTGRFSDEGVERGFSNSKPSQAIVRSFDITDYNYDGFLDILAHISDGNTDYSKRFTNMGELSPGHYKESSETFPFHPEERNSLQFDFNNDGNLDVYEMNSVKSEMTFQIGIGALDEKDVKIAPGSTDHINEALLRGLQKNNTGTDGITLGSMALDYDDDGDIDIFSVNHGETPNLYRNDGGNENDWIRVQVKEKRNMGYRDSVGARVFVTPSKETGSVLTKGVKSSASLNGQNELVAHFGLGNGLEDPAKHLPGGVVYKVRILWPKTSRMDSQKHVDDAPLEAVLYNVPVRTTLVVRRPDRKSDGKQIVANSGATLPVCTHKKITGVSSPKNGQAVVGANGRFIKYRALDHFAGDDSFTYTMEDGRGGSSRATVYVKVGKSGSGPDAEGAENHGKVPEFASLNGRGNNIEFPDHEAAAFVSLLRHVPPAYGGDGLEDAAGSDRPSTRLISNVLFTQAKGTASANIPSRKGLNDLHLHFGQFLAHDVSFVTPLADFYATGNLAIPVPEGDATFDPDYTGEAVIRFRRSGAKQGTGRKYGIPVEQVNKVSGWLDLSVVYGSAAERAIAIRTMKNGKIEMQMGGQNLAYNTKGIANLNLLGKKIERLVISGDNRVNVQPGLLTMHTLWAREHNRYVDELLQNDPTVSDRVLFLRARRHTTAVYQNIVMYEWLPTVLGPKFMRKFNLHSYNESGGYV